VTAGDSLELSAVRKRFNDSADTLDLIHERLRALVLAAETSASATGAIEGASAALQSTAEQLTEMAVQVAAAVRTAGEALTVAERFLQQTDLAGLTTSLDELRTTTVNGTNQTSSRLEQLVVGQQLATDALEKLPGEIDSLRADVVKGVSDLEVRLAAASTAEARAAEAEAKLDALRRSIPARTAKKLGLADLQ
jgi:hypothetical protein